MRRSCPLKDKDDPNQCRIVVTGSELVELKRHAHEIPECPGLSRRMQRYDGKGPFKLSRDEIDWLVAVLDAVLHDPKGYPCVEYEPWKLQYVPLTDERCVTCRRLYDRLNQESERLFAVKTQKRIRQALRRRARDRKKTQKADLFKSRIEAVFKKRGCPAVPARVNRGYTIFYQGAAVSRIRPRSEFWEVLWWSHRDRWESIGDLGGMVFDTIEEAATYVLDDPMVIFWR